MCLVTNVTLSPDPWARVGLGEMVGAVILPLPALCWSRRNALMVLSWVEWDAAPVRCLEVPRRGVCQTPASVAKGHACSGSV